jgi:hypothetical protein
MRAHISPVAFIFDFLKSHIILHLNTRHRSVPLFTLSYINWGHAVVEALRYKPEGRGIGSRWCHWNFSLT